MPERPVFGLTAVRRGEYDEYRSQLEHLFLTGDLRLPTPHPFFRRDDIEVILCTYDAGDVGEPHWHENVDELEMVLEGELQYREAPSGRTFTFETGDFVHIPKGTCVKRNVLSASRTLAMKIPSDSSRVVCSDCARVCSYREAPYRAEVPLHA
jgi:mannose-6-phosphate isomerase-like protein (cupin superfamily)